VLNFESRLEKDLQCTTD
jgi:hypothetical protein